MVVFDVPVPEGGVCDLVDATFVSTEDFFFDIPGHNVFWQRRAFHTDVETKHAREDVDWTVVFPTFELPSRPLRHDGHDPIPIPFLGQASDGIVNNFIFHRSTSQT